MCFIIKQYIYTIIGHNTWMSENGLTTAIQPPMSFESSRN